MQLNARPVRGTWDDGRTLDLHIRSSDFVGYNEYGHAQFESTRTELGELLYRLKYKGDQSTLQLQTAGRSLVAKGLRHRGSPRVRASRLDVTPGDIQSSLTRTEQESDQVSMHGANTYT